MKRFIKITFLSALLATVFGCTSSTYNAPLAPPKEADLILARYKELPGQKVMVMAVDPNGQWAFGYDHSRETLAEAAEKAAIKCDQGRTDYQVLTKASLFAINDEVVYYNRK